LKTKLELFLNGWKANRNVHSRLHQSAMWYQFVLQLRKWESLIKRIWTII